MSTNETGPMLVERIAAVMAEVASEQVKATGKTEFGHRALSIGDVDDLLAPLMAKHGIVSDYEFRRTPRVIYEMPTKNEGVLRMWRVDIDGILWCASGEERRRRLHDIGSSPSGTVSFALKRWHRALFKIVEDDDQVEGQRGGQRSKRLDWKTLACPVCGNIGAVVQRKDKTSWWCVPDKGGCNASIKGEQADAMVAMATGEPIPSGDGAQAKATEPKPANGTVTDDGFAELEELNARLGDKKLAPPVLKARAGRPDGYAKTKAELLSLLPDTAEARS